MILLCDCNSPVLNSDNITAVSTVILAIITGFYAYWTYMMVKINKRDFEISNRPYISVMTMDHRVDNNRLIISIAMKNSGKIPAIISSSEVTAYNEDLTENRSLGRNISSVVINPGEFIGQDIITIDNYTNPRKLTFIFEIKYKTPSQQIDNYFTKYTYSFDSLIEFKLKIKNTEMN